MSAASKYRQRSANIAELQNFIRTCTEIKPDVFIDIGANLGLYTCIVMKNGLAPRAILFEPDRRNRVHLRANLLINDLLDADITINEVALGAEPGKFRLVPGPERDIGLSQIVENAPAGQGTRGYEVDIVRFDDVVSLSGKDARGQDRHRALRAQGARRHGADARRTIAAWCRSKCSKRATKPSA